MNIKDKIYEKLNRASELTSFPGIVIKLNELLENEESNIDDIVDVIKYDAVISSAILRLSNTMAFNISGKVSSIDKAIIRLGFSNIRDLVLAISMIKNFSKGGMLNYEKFWLHSISVAYTAKTIKEYTSEPKELSEELYTTGLLHEIGMLMMDQWLSDLYQEVIKELNRGEKSLTEIEREVMGVTHCEAGGYVLERWNLPKAITDAVRFSKKPHFASATATENAKIIHMADYACNNQHITNGLEESNDIKFSESAWFDLGLSISSIPEIIEQVNEQTEKAKQIILVSTNTEQLV